MSAIVVLPQPQAPAANTNTEFLELATNQTIANRGLAIKQFSNNQASAALVMQKTRGTIASPLDALPGDLIGITGYSTRFNNTPTFDRSLFGAIAEVGGGISQNILTGNFDSNYSPSLRVGSDQNTYIGNFGSAIPYTLESLPQRLNINGRLYLRNQAEPATPVGGGVIYTEGGALKYKGSSGMVTILGLP